MFLLAEEIVNTTLSWRDEPRRRVPVGLSGQRRRRSAGQPIVVRFVSFDGRSGIVKPSRVTLDFMLVEGDVSRLLRLYPSTTLPDLVKG
jgi:hypothetical protein